MDDDDVLTRLVDDYERLGVLYGFATGLASDARERIEAIAQREAAIADLLRHLDTIYPHSSQTQSALEKRDVINLVRRKLATGEPTEPLTDKASLVERLEEVKQRVGQVPDAAGQTYFDEATVPIVEPTKDKTPTCPTCGSDDPDDRLATGEFGAECLDPWHTKDKADE